MSLKSRPSQSSKSPSMARTAQQEQPQLDVAGVDAALQGPVGNAALAARLPPPPEDDAFPFQAELEAAFGVSFAGLDVVLGDPRPAELGASAFTDGDTVVFADTSPSRETVAHELVHVLQQGGGSSDQVEATDHPAEVEASSLASQAAAGQAVSVTGRRGPGIHRVVAPAATPSMLNADFGEQALDPIHLSWDPPRWAFSLEGGEDIAADLSGGLDIGIFLDFEPVTDPEISPEIWVKTSIRAQANGGVAGSLSGEASGGGLRAAGTALRRDSSVEAGISAEASANGAAAYRSKRKHTVESYERVRRGLVAIEPAIDGVLAAYEKGVSLAGDVASHIEAAKKGAEDLEQAFEQLKNIVASGEQIGEWAAELVLLGQALGEILIAAYEVGKGTSTVIGTLMGSAAVAQQLEEGESYEVELNAAAQVGVEGQIDAEGGGTGGKVARAMGSAVSFTAGFDREAASEWNRIFRVSGTADGDTKCVEITVGFERGGSESASNDAAIGRFGVDIGMDTESATQRSAGHQLVVRLPQGHREFDRLYGMVFDAMTPEELIALTYSSDLQFDGQSGLLFLALDKSWMGEQSTSAILSGGDARGLVQGGTEGYSSSHVVIDYENGGLRDVDVSAGGEQGLQLNPGDNSLTRSLGTELDDLIGINPFEDIDPIRLWGAENSFHYDGDVASFSGQGGTLDNLVDRVRVAMGKNQIRALVDRAGQSGNWSDLAAFIFNAGLSNAWDKLGANLRKTRTRGTTVDIGSGLGTSRGVASLRVLVPGSGGMEPAFVGNQPYIPPKARADWSVFLAADLIGSFIGAADEAFGADDVTNLFLQARGMNYESSGSWREYEADYSEIGIEMEGDVEHSDGTEMSDKDWFVSVEDHSIDLRVQLEQATVEAHSTAQAQLDRQRDTGAAIVHSPDQRLITRVEAHLGELESILADLKKPRPFYSNDNAVGSMTRFATTYHTDLAQALARYHAAFGAHYEMSGHAVALDGGRHDYRTSQLEGDDSPQARAADTRAAEGLVLSMDRALDVAESRIEAYDVEMDEWSPDIGDYAVLYAEVAEAMGRWHTMNQAFHRAYSKYPESNPMVPGERFDHELWRDAITHGRRDGLVVRARAHDGAWTTSAEWKEGIADAAPGADAPLENAYVPDPPEASPELFYENYPYPDALVGKLDNKTSAERRSLHETLSPQELRAISPDSCHWGISSLASDYAVKMAAGIAHALTTNSVPPGFVWTITGHTDQTDTHLHNAYLGYRRALVVRRLLIDAGVPPAVLAVRSRGESAPTWAVTDDMDERKQASANRYNRRVLRDDGQEATDALFGFETAPEDLAFAMGGEDETSTEATRMRQRRRAGTQDAFDEEIGRGTDATKFSLIVQELYDGRTLNLMTVVAGLVGIERAKLLFAAHRAFRMTELAQACRDAEIDMRVPVNELALGEAESQTLEFQPAVMQRDDRYTMSGTSKLWKVAGIELARLRNTSTDTTLDAAIRELLAFYHGPQLMLTFPGGVNDAIEPQTMSVDGDFSVSFSIVAGSERAVGLLDRLSTDLALRVVDFAGCSIEPLGARADDPMDAAMRELRTKWVVWTVADGTVTLDSSCPPLSGIDTETMQQAWAARTRETLQGLQVDVSLGGPAHSLVLGPLCEVTDTASTGEPVEASFDMSRAFDDWMRAQGRDLRGEHDTLRGRFARAIHKQVIMEPGSL